jgi:hypothetical protein
VLEVIADYRGDTYRAVYTVTFGILLIAAVSISIVAVASADLARVRALSPRGVAALLYLAIAGLAVGTWFWQVGVWALRRGPPPAAPVPRLPAPRLQTAVPACPASLARAAVGRPFTDTRAKGGV